jgi:hypothetical protein
MSTPKHINPNTIPVRDYVTMNEILRAKGGPHKNRKKEASKKACRGKHGNSST